MTHAAPHPSQATHILVVEDDFDTREFYEVLLMAEGYDVLAAGTGREALARLGAQPLNGIVLDRRLPDFDGVDLCRLLRQRVDTSVPIIFVTADRDPTLEATARSAGITEFLLKPFRPADLLDHLARLIAPSVG
jgi:DNA-binding response OmpR family regulator